MKLFIVRSNAFSDYFNRDIPVSQLFDGEEHTDVCYNSTNVNFVYLVVSDYLFKIRVVEGTVTVFFTEK